MATGDETDDPGWGRLPDIVIGALLPWRNATRAASGASLLVSMRTAFLAFVSAVAFFGLTSAFVVEEVDDPLLEPGVAAIVVLVIGVVLQLVPPLIRRDLPSDDIGELLGIYRARFFLRIAFANMSALLGVIASYSFGSMAPYLVSLVPAALGFARAAPTRGNIARDQARLAARGSSLDLFALLREAQPG